MQGLYNDIPPPAKVEEESKKSSSTSWTSTKSRQVAAAVVRKQSLQAAHLQAARARQRRAQIQMRPKLNAKVTIISETSSSTPEKSISATIAAAPIDRHLLYDPMKPNLYEQYIQEKAEMEKAKEMAKRIEEQTGVNIEQSINEESSENTGGSTTAAQRMMEKMGWVAGKGLGKEGQGITVPLVHEKTSERTGNIVLVDTSSVRNSDNMDCDDQNNL